MTELRLRRARRADLVDLLRIIADNDVARARGTYVVEETPAVVAAFDAIMASTDNELWVGERDGAVAATAQLTFLPGLAHGGAWPGRKVSCAVSGLAGN